MMKFALLISLWLPLKASASPHESILIKVTESNSETRFELTPQKSKTLLLEKTKLKSYRSRLPSSDFKILQKIIIENRPNHAKKCLQNMDVQYKTGKKIQSYSACLTAPDPKSKNLKRMVQSLDVISRLKSKAKR